MPSTFRDISTFISRGGGGRGRGRGGRGRGRGRGGRRPVQYPPPFYKRAGDNKVIDISHKVFLQRV
jgi:hypothetical protein